MDKTTHPYFVPDDTQGSRKETAVLLTGTAREFDIPQREVAATQGGFRISENVYKALGWDEDDSNDEVGDGDARVAPGAVASGEHVSSPLDPSDPDAEPEAEVPTEDEVEDDEDAPEPEDGHPEVLPYEEWAYADLRTEVANRNLATDDLKTETLVAALNADDASDDDI